MTILTMRPREPLVVGVGVIFVHQENFSWYHEISLGIMIILTMRFLMVTMWFLVTKLSLQEVHEE